MDDIDLSSFEDVPEPQAYYRMCRISLTTKAQLNLNEPMRSALGETNAFRFQVSPDGRTISLDPAGPCNLTFSAQGHRTHHVFFKMLQEKGLEPPVSYRMEWNEKLRRWIGHYEGLTPPPAVEKLLDGGPPPRKRRGKAI